MRIFFCSLHNVRSLCAGLVFRGIAHTPEKTGAIIMMIPGNSWNQAFDWSEQAVATMANQPRDLALDPGSKLAVVMRSLSSRFERDPRNHSGLPADAPAVLRRIRRKVVPMRRHSRSGAVARSRAAWLMRR